MDVTTVGSGNGETSGETGVITLHYWAAAKSAAGVAGDELPVDGPISLAEVVRRAVALHPGTRLPDVLQTCSALLGDRPVTAEDPAGVQVAPGTTVEFLPPFAGG
jgi:sulfur-carrier protein